MAESSLFKIFPMSESLTLVGVCVHARAYIYVKSERLCISVIPLRRQTLHALSRLQYKKGSGKRRTSQEEQNKESGMEERDPYL